VAQKVNVTVTDDLEGSENAETVTFGFEEKTYELDLAKKNRAKLEKALEPFVGAARRHQLSHGAGEDAQRVRVSIVCRSNTRLNGWPALSPAGKPR